MGSKFRLALIQLSVGANKSENLLRATNKISEAVQKGANVVSLPGINNNVTSVDDKIDVFENVLTAPMELSTSKSMLSLFLMVQMWTMQRRLHLCSDTW